MTKIKLCGLKCRQDIEMANRLSCDYVGFVFAKKSSRYVSPELAGELKALLSPKIQAVGVFVKEEPETIARLLASGVIDMAQLHGQEAEEEVLRVKQLTDKPIIKAFSMVDTESVEAAKKSRADYVLLDSGNGGTGEVFDWTLLKTMERPYFLAGGLTADNVSDAVKELQPFAVDVSSGIETEGQKDPVKMEAFVLAAREANAEEKKSSREAEKKRSREAVRKEEM